jgi:hypothetical protein
MRVRGVSAQGRATEAAMAEGREVTKKERRGTTANQNDKQERREKYSEWGGVKERRCIERGEREIKGNKEERKGGKGEEKWSSEEKTKREESNS